LRNKQEAESTDDGKLVDQGTESEEGEIKIEKSELEKKLEENQWEERFKEFTDSKPRGKKEDARVKAH
jgi:alpha 1,3-glucosidase